MININEMWRETSTVTGMSKPTGTNAWALDRMGQNPTVASPQVNPNSKPTGQPHEAAVAPAANPAANPRGFNLVFNEPGSVPGSVLFGGPPVQKMGGLEDAMERLNMVSCAQWEMLTIFGS